MDILNRYIIPYKEYKNGTHHFEFEISRDLFDAFDEDEIKKAEVLAEVEMNRHDTETTLEIRLSGNVTVECDRCLDELVLPVSFESKAKLTFDADETDTEFDMICVAPEEEKACLGEYLYESILLSLPSRKVHADTKDCNPEMLRRFNIVSQEEFDAIEAQRHTIGENPEFEKLAELKKTLE